MFEDLGSFDQAYGRAGVGGPVDPVQPLRRRKSLSQRAAFWTANALILPLVAVCYLTISAEGLRNQLPVMATRLSRLPIPGAGTLGLYDGWDRLDVAMLMALALFAAVTLVWVRVFGVLMDASGVDGLRRHNPLLFFAVAAVVAVLVLGDLMIFYAGLQAKAASGWTATPWYVAPLASVLYMSGLAAIGAWHADYHRADAV